MPLQSCPEIAAVESLESLPGPAESSRTTTSVTPFPTIVADNADANASRSMTSTTHSSFSSDDASGHSRGGSSISSSSSFTEQQQQPAFGGNAIQQKQERQSSVKHEMSMGYRIERGNEAQEQVKAIADSIFSSPRKKCGGNLNETQVPVLAAGEARVEREEGSLGFQQLARLPVVDETMEEQEEASPAFGAGKALIDLSPSSSPHAQQPQEAHKEEQQQQEQQAQFSCWDTNSHHNTSIESRTSGNSKDGGKVIGEDDDDDESLIALVEADFQDALIQSYETFARDSFTTNYPTTFEALPTVIDTSGVGDEDIAIVPRPSYQQTLPSSTVCNPPRRGTTVGDYNGVTAVQQHRDRRGSNGNSVGTRDGLMAAAAKALPTTLTYAPYGFCLISRFSFINSLRAPLAALFDPKNTRHPSALRAIQDYLAAQSPIHIPLNAADRHESLCLLQTAPAPSAISPHVAAAAAALSPSGLLSPFLAKPAPTSTSAAINSHPATLLTPSPPQHQHQYRFFTQIDFELETLFQCLNPRNLVLVFLALLLECKVLLISERLTLLTIAGEGLRFLLHPLKWCHVYVPLVPEVMIDHVIGCPTPFIMGLHRKTYLQRQDDFPADIVQVDLDNDYVEAPAKDLNRKNAPFAGPLARNFERLASPATALSDSCHWAPYTQGPAHAMTNFRSSNNSSSKNSGLPSSPVSAAAIGAAPGPWLALQMRDMRAALLVLRDFVEGLLMGIEDSCYCIYTETEMTILFDETLFGHICGPAELLLITPNEPDTDALPHSPHLPPAPPNDATAQEDFVLRFCRTQAFSNALMKGLQRDE